MAEGHLAHSDRLALPATRAEPSDTRGCQPRAPIALYARYGPPVAEIKIHIRRCHSELHVSSYTKIKIQPPLAAQKIS